MSATETKVNTKPLHLPSLTIKGFRGINELSISRLGRVTLLAGKNGVGKTTVLEAVRIYAARGRSRILMNVLEEREELTEFLDEFDNEILVPNWDTLFHRRDISTDGRGSHTLLDSSYVPRYPAFSFGPLTGTDKLSISFAPMNDEDLAPFSSDIRLGLVNEEWRMLEISIQEIKVRIPMPFLRSSKLRVGYLSDDRELPPMAVCESLGPSLLTNTNMARFWDRVALTDDEDRAVRALNLIFGKDIERIAVVADERRGRHGRRTVVKLRGEKRPVPLKSLGDGAVRLFGVALALASSRDGFLVIDEAENGIHHSVQRDYWKMIVKTARENNVQVLATTHGWDCVRGFAQAAADVDDVEVALVRLEKDGDAVRAVEYSERNLKAAARSGIEVR
ncbi:MAG: AAA family ATPase [Chloroflexi bacterium]|nr:AAA family ATPase [Chloroflexota bacterium]MCY3939286.1 AAA family ATPase [Chloroflexota bacterium]